MTLICDADCAPVLHVHEAKWVPNGGPSPAYEQTKRWRGAFRIATWYERKLWEQT